MSAFKTHNAFSADHIAHCTVRLLKPACVFQGEWTQEGLPTQSKRAVEKLHGRTCADANALTPLLAPAFAFCFTLLQQVLNERRKMASANEDVTMVKALAVIEAHAKLRQDDEAAFLDEVQLFSRSKNLTKDFISRLTLEWT